MNMQLVSPMTSTLPSVPSSWDMPANTGHFFPRNEEDRLANKTGYFVWSHRMRKALSYCGLLDIVDGTLPEPTDATQRAVWLKMDAAASVLITSCITGDLVIKITHVNTAKGAWDFIAKEYSQGSGPIIHWFRRLTKHMASGGDISAHIIEYQEAVRYLAHANFALPEWLAAAILLSTLPCDPKDPDSWDSFVTSVKMDKATTTLSNIISEILEEKRCHWPTPATTSTSSETARAINTKFCTNCEREGHIQEECPATSEEAHRKAQREAEAEERARVRSRAKAHREALLAARSEEYTRRKATTEQKMEGKEKRRQAYAAQKEAEAARKAGEERLRAAAERCLAEEAEAARKRQEERLAEQRREREDERAATAEEARRKAQREAEAEERARLRSQAKTEGVWRRTQAQASGGWRARAASPKVISAPLPERKKDAGEVEVVPEKKVWRPKRLQNRS